MSNIWDAVPVISQLKSLWQACVGDMEGARTTQETFTMVCPIVSQLRSLIELSMGDADSARSTQERFSRNCPVVAQIRSFIEYISGDEKAAWQTHEEFFSGPGVGLAITAIGAILGPFIGAAIIGALGFGEGGIAAGSAAAYYMSTHGGAVSAWSICAVLQSAGAIGFSASMNALLSVAGAALAIVITEIVKYFMSKEFFF